eukprot:scaffold37175_cov53-Phaeocystis_antarctica.AAC.1
MPLARCRRPTPPRLPAHTSLGIVRPRFDSAVRRLLVRRQQAADPLRVGGQLGLRLCWLRLELGSGKLPATVAALALALAATAIALPAAAATQPAAAISVAATVTQPAAA